MSDELPKAKAGKSLDERFSKHPHMYQQMQRIADMMEQAIARGATADEAEEMAIKQVNDLGRAILTDWAQAKHDGSVRELKTQRPSATKDSKKN
jgi:Flp pilus assembly protein TadG